jgi:integrase
VAFRIQRKKEHFRLASCTSREQAEKLGTTVVGILVRLRKARKEHMAETFCRQAAESEPRRLAGILTLLDGVIAGTEHEAPPPPAERLRVNASDSTGAASSLPAIMTFGEFAELWTSNELARRYRRRIKEIDHTENRRRLKNHILAVTFRGKKIGDTPLSEFTLDHADHVLAQRKLPEGSVRQVAQVMHRILRLAEYPARLIEHSPFPRGWLPDANPEKARGYLFPSEDLMLMGYQDAPLVKRIYIGMANREGPRRGNLVNLDWSSLLLDLADGSGFLWFDKTKNGRDASWALDPGTAEALRRWKKICPSETWVFPELALPPGRKFPRTDRPMCLSHLSDDLRAWLQACGVNRPKLFERSEHRLPLRAHDLRATFVTLALANGKTEAWVMKRTGHTTSIMLNRYRRDAESIAELNLGWLKPLQEAIPELAAMKSKANGKPEDAALPEALRA